MKQVGLGIFLKNNMHQADKTHSLKMTKNKKKIQEKKYRLCWFFQVLPHLNPLGIDFILFHYHI